MGYSPEIPFCAYVSLWGEDAGSLTRRFLSPEYLQGQILAVVSPVLVYLINEYRLQDWLDGDSPEKRYRDFEASARQKVVPDVASRFPEVLERLHSQLDSLESLCTTVLQRFICE